MAQALFYFEDQVYNNPFYLNLTKPELASLIGTSCESVSRLLREFHDAGITEMNKNVKTILNEEKLEQIKLKR